MDLWQSNKLAPAPLLLLVCTHPQTPPPPSSFLSPNKEGSWNAPGEKQTEALQCFFLKAGYCSTEPVSCLGICFPPHATPVINWLWDCFIGMLLWLLWNKLTLALCAFFFSNAPGRQEKGTSCFLKPSELSRPEISATPTCLKNV